MPGYADIYVCLILSMMLNGKCDSYYHDYYNCTMDWIQTSMKYLVPCGQMDRLSQQLFCHSYSKPWF